MKFILNVFVIFIFVIINTKAYRLNPKVGMYYKYHSDAATWSNAVRICESENATLALPRDKQEVNALIEIFKLKTRYIPVGFHNRFFYQEFITITGVPLQYYYNIWDPSEPDNGADRCGFLFPHAKIYDGNCEAALPFVCQRETAKRKKPRKDPRCSTSDTEYKYAEGTEKCYKIHMNAKRFTDAQITCESEGGYLTIIRNEIEEEFLSALFRNPKYTAIYAQISTMAIIGIHNIIHVDEYRTVLNEKFSDIGYEHWRHKILDSTNRCVAMDKDGLLNHFYCNTAGFFICEQPADGKILIKKRYHASTNTLLSSNTPSTVQPEKNEASDTDDVSENKLKIDMGDGEPKIYNSTIYINNNYIYGKCNEEN